MFEESVTSPNRQRGTEIGENPSLAQRARVDQPSVGARPNGFMTFSFRSFPHGSLRFGNVSLGDPARHGSCLCGKSLTSIRQPRKPLPMLTIAEFHDAEQLKPLESVWNRLCNRTPNACSSHSFDSVFSNRLPGGGRLRVLLGIIRGRPFGILPLKVEQRVLTGLAEPELPFAGPVGPDTTAMLIASFRHLQRARRDWDRIEFCTAGDFEPLENRLKNAFRVVGWNCEIEPARGPISESGTNATRRGFRYTHVSPWALRARWRQFRERFSARRNFTQHPPEACPCPGPHRLSLYAPPTIETPNSSAP